MDEKDSIDPALFLDGNQDREKREIAAQLEKSAPTSSEDPTRSSLHYGDTYTGDHEPERPVNEPVEVDPTANQDATGAIETFKTDTHSEMERSDPNGLPTTGPASKDGDEHPDASSSGGMRDQTAENESLVEASFRDVPFAESTVSEGQNYPETEDAPDLDDRDLPFETITPFGDADHFEFAPEVVEKAADGAERTEIVAEDTTSFNEAPPFAAERDVVTPGDTDDAPVSKPTVVEASAGNSPEVIPIDEESESVEENAAPSGDDETLPQDVYAESPDPQPEPFDTGAEDIIEPPILDALPVPDITVSSGFHAQYFDVDHSLRKLDDVDWSADPTHEEITGKVDYRNSADSFWEGGSKDTFGVQINGNVVVEEAGAFKFSLGGDDGAVLFVNGQPVIDNDGLHGFRMRSGEIELDPGTHHIEVRYFENRGHAGLKLEWEGPGIDGKELVEAPDPSDAQTISGVPISLNISLEEVEAEYASTLTLWDLPEGTVVQAGDQSVVVDDSGGADITGWETDVLAIVPPLDFAGEVSAVLSVSTENDDGARGVAHHPVAFQVNEAQFNPPSAELSGGFQASYYDVDHSLRSIDDIDWDGTPTHEEFVADVNYEKSRESFWEGGSKDTFGAKIEGQITIEEGGDYTFFAGGDDGVVLYVDGVEVIDNDGLHGFRTRSGEVDLEPGTYDIELRYFENRGDAGLELEWEGPDTDGREFVQADLLTSVEENGTLELGVTLKGAGEEATVLMTDLPADAIVISGDMSAVSDGGPVDLSGWDTSLLEISPPPGFEGVIDGGLVITSTAFNGAETSSTTQFSIVVGDEVAQESETDAAQEDVILANDSTELSETEQGWDTDVEQDDTGVDDNVMAEEAVVQDSQSVADLDLDTYERVDW